ncbi:MAG: hypothetical protein CME19_22985 [Gemmatimonadetes bacterium]|nr:hypothetical protein [Gemmatimonadota bacterium]
MWTGRYRAWRGSVRQWSKTASEADHRVFGRATSAQNHKDIAIKWFLFLDVLMFVVAHNVRWIGLSTQPVFLFRREDKMITLISSLMLAALALQVFCFMRLSDRNAQDPVRVRPTPSAKAEEEKKTKLGRPIWIVHINA